MANYMGSTFENTEVQSNINLPLINQVLATKQQTYDANRAKITQTLEAFGGLDLERDIDKEYVSMKINEVNSAIANVGNRDLSQSFIADDIIGKVKNIAKDPFVLSAVENTRKLRSFQANVEKIREKKPEMYNDRNYTDALEQGGFDTWKNGDTNTLGSLRYNEYVDVQGNIDKKVQDYVSKFKMQEQFLGTDTSNPLFYLDQYGKKVTKGEIRDYITSTLDEKSKVQLGIDVRQTVGKYAQADLNNYIRDYKTYENDAANLEIAGLEARKLNASKVEKDLIDQNITKLKTYVGKNKEAISKGEYDKNDMYGIYTSKLFDGIASNYDMDIITKIDRDDMPFQVYKFNDESQYRKESLALKKKEVAAAETANQIALGGTVLTVPTPSEDERPSNEELIQKDLYRSDKSLDAYLKETNLEGYNNKKPAEQWEFKKSLTLSNPSQDNADPKLNSLVLNFKNSQTAFSKTFSPAMDATKNLFTTAYNDMVGGRDLNVDNLASTMPFTASVLKTKKSFENLSAEQKSGVLSEMMTNQLQYGEVGGDMEREILTKALVREQTNLKNNRSPQADIVRAATKTSTADTESVGFFGAIHEATKAAFTVAKNAVDMNVVNPIVGLARAAFYGEDYAKDKYAKAVAEDNADLQKAKKSLGYIKNVALDFFPYIQDTNISEVEVQDLRADSNVSKKYNSIDGFISSNLTEIKNQTNRTAGNYTPNLNTSKAVSFSTNIKAQKDKAEELRQIVMSAEGAPAGFDKSDIFQVNREGNNFRIFYTNKEGQTVSITTPTLSQDLEARIDLTNVNFKTSALNANMYTEPVVIAPYAPNEDRAKTATNIQRQLSGKYPDEALRALIVNPQATFLATPSEIKAQYKGKLTADIEPEVDRILNTPYLVKPEAIMGGIYPKVYYKDAQGAEVTEVINVNLGANYDPNTFYMDAQRYLRAYKENKIETLLNQ